MASHATGSGLAPVVAAAPRTRAQARVGEMARGRSRVRARLRGLVRMLSLRCTWTVPWRLRPSATLRSHSPVVLCCDSAC